MKFETYSKIVKSIHEQSRPGDRNDCIATLMKSFEGVNAQTLGSIYSQEILKKVKKSYHKHSNKAESFYHRFKRMAKDPKIDKHEVIIFNIAREIDFPPSMLVKMIVEKHLLYRKRAEIAEQYTARQNNGAADAADDEDTHLSLEAAIAAVSVSKQELNKTLRHPEVFADDFPRLAFEIELCNVVDDDYGPLSDIIKQSIGHEKEVFLKRRAKELNLVFKDEEQMRAEGFDKTPDLRLEIPIAIDGVVIHWIESKASFGDESTHAVYLKDQFWSYQNRFGPGIVIYWFGFVEELDVNRSKGILLYDHLPEDFVVFDPDKI